MLENKYLVYVDGINGNDSNTGDILSPVKTLQHAYDISKNGAIIVLQTNPISYGDLSITKNITLRSACGIRAKVGELDASNAQISALDLDCVSTTGTGIYIDNSGIDKVGCLQVTNCTFVSSSYPIILENCNYASIHRNKFETYLKAIQINGCTELTASANTFCDGPQAFEVLNLDYLDIYNNTLFGKISVPPPTETNINLRVIYVKINNTILSRKYIDLPTYAAANESGYIVAVNTVNGTSFNYGSDYTVINLGRVVSWVGLELETELRAGDMLRIMYSDAGLIATGEIIYASISNPLSRIDSNNINDGLVGVHFSGDMRIRYNNFYGTYTGIIGVSSDYTGNINSDPKYVDKPFNDFRLDPDSPDIHAADPSRSGQILQELGVGLTGGGFTGIFSVERKGIAPFDRNIDKDGRHRFTLKNRDDIGAYEYPNTGINVDPYTYVYEDGYDIDVPGSYTGPYSTVDRGFQDTKDIRVNTNILMYEGYTGAIDQGATGTQYGRYYSDDLNLSNDQLLVGKGNKNNVIYIYPSFPSCGVTGVFVGPQSDTISGDTGSITNPFLDIKDAIENLGSNSGTIFVYPSFYSSFKGYTGIEIVGLPKINNINLDKNVYNTYAAVGWTGANFATFDNGYLCFNGTDDLMSLFKMQNSFSVRFDMLVIMDKLETKIFNDSNFVSVAKSGSTLIFKYNTGGVTYTATTGVMDSNNSYRLSISVEDDKAVVKMKGISTNIERDINLVSGYTGLWSMDYSYTYNSLSGWTGILSNFMIEADQITSNFGYTGTAIGRKVYGIVGETGLNDWYKAGL